MKLPQEYVTMLEEHCEKLEAVEGVLFEKFDVSRNREDAETWLTAQNQLRLTANELMKQQTPPKADPTPTESPALASFRAKLRSR